MSDLEGQYFNQILALEDRLEKMNKQLNGQGTALAMSRSIVEKLRKRNDVFIELIDNFRKITLNHPGCVEELKRQSDPMILEAMKKLKNIAVEAGKY